MELGAVLDPKSLHSQVGTHEKPYGLYQSCRIGYGIMPNHNAVIQIKDMYAEERLRELTAGLKQGPGNVVPFGPYGIYCGGQSL